MNKLFNLKLFKVRLRQELYIDIDFFPILSIS